MTNYWTKQRNEIEISHLMTELRAKLNDAGFIWKDESEEFGFDEYVYHMERTKVLGPEWLLASCIYGYSGKKGFETGSTYGWPDSIEGWPTGSAEPEPMTIEEIVEAVKTLCQE